MSAAPQLLTSLTFDDRCVTLRVRHNPRARRMILKIDHTSGEIHVTSPTKKAMKEAVGFAAREEAWIRKKLAELPEPLPFQDGAQIPFRGGAITIANQPDARRGVWLKEEADALMVSGDPAFTTRRVTEWLRREARKALLEAVAEYTVALDLPLPKVTLRDTTSRWGSCSSSGALSFSWRLIMAPPDVLAYVAAHECAHLRHLNHSKAFWSLVKHLHPDYKRAELWMKTNSITLFRYGQLSQPRLT